MMGWDQEGVPREDKLLELGIAEFAGALTAPVLIIQNKGNLITSFDIWVEK